MHAPVHGSPTVCRRRMRIRERAGRRPTASAGARAVARSFGAIAVAAVALPASAMGAATLTTERSCYTEGEQIRFTGTGFSPSSPVVVGLAANGRSGEFNPATSDAAGGVAFTGNARGLDDVGAARGAGPGPTRLEVLATATDQATLGPAGPAPTTLLGQARFTLADWELHVRPWETAVPAPGKPRRVVTLRTYGWTSLTGTLYAHYVRQGRLVHTVALGRLRGPCGDLTRTMREFPFRPVPAGSYLVQFDTRLDWIKAAGRLGYQRVVVKPADAVP